MIRAGHIGPALLVLCVSAAAAAAEEILPPLDCAQGLDAVMAEATGAEGAEFRTERDWMIVTVPKLRTIYSVAPEGHAAYPAVVRRQVLEAETGSVVDMAACGFGDEAAFDRLMEEFEELNARVLGACADGSAACGNGGE